MRASPRALVGLGFVMLVALSASTWWALRHSAQLGSSVAALARPGDIRMLSSDTCVVCGAARQWFTAHGVAYSECSIERDPACSADFNASQAPGTPVLLVRGKTLVGFTPEHVLAALTPAAR